MLFGFLLCIPENLDDVILSFKVGAHDCLLLLYILVDAEDEVRHEQCKHCEDAAQNEEDDY